MCNFKFKDSKRLSAKYNEYFLPDLTLKIFIASCTSFSRKKCFFFELGIIEISQNLKSTIIEISSMYCIYLNPMCGRIEEEADQVKEGCDRDKVGRVTAKAKGGKDSVGLLIGCLESVVGWLSFSLAFHFFFPFFFVLHAILLYFRVLNFECGCGSGR